MQLFALPPPVEHAPDHTASRPFDTVSVIAVPEANVADAVLPTATLMPAGLDVTRSPLRPVADTDSVTDCVCGATVSVAVRVTPPALEVTVAAVESVTALVAIGNDALAAPCAMVTLAGTVAAVELLDSVTLNPPVGAAALSVTVPCDALPPTTLAGLTDSAESDAAAAGGDTVSGALRVTPP